MHRLEFNAKYNDALIKAAIGVHVIEEAGAGVNLDQEMIDLNIVQLCTTLANAFGLDPMNVVNDVVAQQEKLPDMFITDPRVQRYITELESAYEKQMSNELIVDYS